MIKNTFLHVDGVSVETQRKIEEAGINCWEDFVENKDSIDFLSENKVNEIISCLNDSFEHLENSNFKYFSDKLHEKEHWRLIPYGKICFLDIETTGLSRWTDDITLIGIYDKDKQHLFIKDQNLEEFEEKIKDFDIIVTFNGRCFDLPFIEYKLGTKFNDKIHLDLRFMLKEFGLSGGLKKIERELGIVRPDEVLDVDGREAVRLWRKYKNFNDENALEILKKYNYEDIVNLEKILRWYVKKKVN